jgi:hypothetical protein
MKVIITKITPNISLKRRPPQRTRRNTFSDLLMLKFIARKPIEKLMVESIAPSNIDLKSTPEICEVTKRMVNRDIITKVTRRAE